MVLSNRVEIVSDGRNMAKLSGSDVRDLALDGKGSGSFEVDVFGYGEVALKAAEILDVKVAGTARVTYIGSPMVSQRILGIGSVSQRIVTSDTVER